MRNETRQHFEAYLAQQASLNGVSSALNKFSAAPSVQQKMETKIQESSTFLSKINVMPVTEQSGQKLGLGVTGPIARTTNTDLQPRQPSNVANITEDDDYFCTQTDFDTFIKYATLDAWAKFPNFQTRIRDAILARQALDRIMIGFNGISRASTSNPNVNPLRQDVNKGWLQKYREKSPQRVLSSGKTQNQIRIGPNIDNGNHVGTDDYANLDALVFDLVNNMIDPWFQEDTDLVAIMGRSLLADKYFPLVNQNQPATETMATDLIISQKRVGGLPAVRVPHFPDGKILVTTLDNLSLYWQEGSRRRHIKEAPELNRIENFDSSNDAYVVEDYGRGALAENIAMV